MGGLSVARFIWPYARPPVLKQACLDALDTEDEPGNPSLFFSIVDPGSVLELVEIAETAIFRRRGQSAASGNC
jgi:hypothetical protein